MIEESCVLDGEGVYHVAIYGYEGSVDYTLDAVYSLKSKGLITQDTVNLSIDAVIGASEGDVLNLN